MEFKDCRLSRVAVAWHTVRTTIVYIQVVPTTKPYKFNDMTNFAFIFIRFCLPVDFYQLINWTNIVRKFGKVTKIIDTQNQFSIYSVSRTFLEEKFTPDYVLFKYFRKQYTAHSYYYLRDSNLRSNYVKCLKCSNFDY